MFDASDSGATRCTRPDCGRGFYRGCYVRGCVFCVYGTAWSGRVARGSVVRDCVVRGSVVRNSVVCI